MKNKKTTHNRGTDDSMRRFRFLIFVGLMLSNLLLLPSVDFAQAGRWVRKKEMPTARYALSSAVVAGKIYVAGGWNNKAGFLKTVEMYDPNHNTWKPKAELSQGNLGVALAAANGKIYAIGGWGGGNSCFNTVEEYDPVVDKWTKKANMPTARNWIGTAVVDDIIYAIGGATCEGDTSVVEAYDPLSNRWTEKANLPISTNCIVAAVEGKIYAMGCNTPNPIRNVYEYDPTVDEWTQKADIPTARLCPSADSVGGKIYVVGGTISRNPRTKCSTVEIYDAKTDTWTRGVDLPDSRSHHTSVVVKGEIYVFGGYDKWVGGFPNKVVSTVDAFDTGTFSVSPRGKLVTTWATIKQEM